jgi:hypothetical protein
VRSRPPFGDQSRTQHLCQRGFHELAADNVYTDGALANPVLVSGWIREGHPKTEVTRLATEIASAVSRIAAVAAEQVLVVFESSPASFAVEGGRVLPEPGQEQAWIVGSGGS